MKHSTSTLLLAALIAAAIALTGCAPGAPTQALRESCSSYASQADAQAAADTADADGDGLYCESLPCPCASGPAAPTSPARATATPKACARPKKVQVISFSATKYPAIRAHTLAAIANGWPQVLVVNRAGATARRARLMAESGFPTREGSDRDEYPPAVGRGRGPGLELGTNPRGWQADLAYVPSAENQSHGFTLGNKLRRLCDGTRFRYLFY